MLDLFRFFAALVVMLYHYQYNLQGYSAVMIFFVLSGYFISSSVYKSILDEKWNWVDYLTKRIVRLWLVLIPALVLTYVWARLQEHFFGYTWVFQGNLNPKTLIGNLFFLQGISVNIYGNNGPLWSLSYEFWYYMMFPCVLLLLTSKNLAKKLIYAFLLGFIFYFVGKQIRLYFLIWMIGAVIPFVKPMITKWKSANFLILFLSFLALLYFTHSFHMIYPGVTQVTTKFHWDLEIGLSTAFFIYWIASMFHQVEMKNKWLFAKKFAGFSYTLYAVHYPLMWFWFAWQLAYWGKFHHVGWIKIGFILVVMVYAYIIAQFTEEKTGRITKKILQNQWSLKWKPSKKVSS